MLASLGASYLKKSKMLHGHTRDCRRRRNFSTPLTQSHDWNLPNKRIVHMNWLIQSAKARDALPCNDFLLNDKEAEEKYNFKMRALLQGGDKLRSKNRCLLSGYGVYVCSGVAGNKAPPEEELKLIVDAAGGKWLSSIAPRGAVRETDASKTIMVTKDNLLSHAAIEKDNTIVL